MKKIKFFVLLAVVMLCTACHDKLWDSIEDLDSRVTKLEELCKEMNTNISALQTIVEVIQENDFITGIVPIEKGGELIGYTIMFGKHEPITIYNGEDGKDGANGSGSTPIIGVAKDTDGIYYWTLNGEWLLDADGNKIRVTGENGKNGADGKDGVDGTNGKDGVDGEDGKDGQDGQNGTNGKDGVTPQLKIEEGYWYVSYDNGATWTEVGKAVGENGEKGDKGDQGEKGEKGDKGDKGDAGNDGQNGDSMFSNVTFDDENVYFMLTNGTVLIVPRGNENGSTEGNNPSDIIEFKDLNVKSALLQIGEIDINKDGEISYGEAANYKGALKITNNTNILSFKECQYFTGVTSVSFEKCTNLFEITLPNTLDTISNNAFYNNDKLTFIAIPDSCKFIGNASFYDCGNLNSISISNSCTSLKIGSQAFYYCKKLNNVVIPSVCDTIMDRAFMQCSSLSELEIKDGCLYIGNSAFFDCALTDVVLPNSLKYLGRWSFDCKTLTSFVFPEQLTEGEMPYGWFAEDYKYDNLVSVVWNPENYIGTLRFYNSNPTTNIEGIAAIYYTSTLYASTTGRAVNLTNIVIGNNVKIIPDYFCIGAKNITSIVLPEKVIKIGYSAFANCSSLYMIYSKNPVPPSLSGDIFKNSKVNIIYVPIASVDAYKAAWSNYADKIVGCDF